MFHLLIATMPRMFHLLTFVRPCHLGISFVDLGKAFGVSYFAMKGFISLPHYILRFNFYK